MKEEPGARPVGWCTAGRCLLFVRVKTGVWTGMTFLLHATRTGRGGDSSVDCHPLPFLPLQWNPSPPPRDVPFSGIIISPLKVGCHVLLVVVLNVCVCVSANRKCTITRGCLLKWNSWKLFRTHKAMPLVYM